MFSDCKIWQVNVTIFFNTVQQDYTSIFWYHCFFSHLQEEIAKNSNYRLWSFLENFRRPQWDNWWLFKLFNWNLYVLKFSKCSRALFVMDFQLSLLFFLCRISYENKWQCLQRVNISHFILRSVASPLLIKLARAPWAGWEGLRPLEAN